MDGIHTKDLYVAPGDTVKRPVMRGATIFVGQGAKVLNPVIDCEGAKYGIKSHGLHRKPRTVKEFLSLRTYIEAPTITNAANKALLTECTEVRGGDYSNCGNDVWASSGPWNLLHGLPGMEFYVHRMGYRPLDPDGHSDPFQPWHSHCAIMGSVTVDLRDSDGEGGQYAEAGAGVFIKPDFGPIENVVVHGITVITTRAYAVRSVPDGGTGEFATGVQVTGCRLIREDGKHPLDVPRGTFLMDNVDMEGNPVGRLPS